MTTTALTATGPATIVGIQHNGLNLSIFQVTPLEDGMELVEYLGHAGTNAPEEATNMVLTARDMARVTGAKFATNRWETRTAEGELKVTAQATWYSTPYVGPRLAQGVHRATVTMSPEQKALATEAASQTKSPIRGQRYVVAETTGYQPIQGRSFDHQGCSCGTGTTVYHVGTVVDICAWMDNSMDVEVQCEDGKSRRVQIVAPHGDICY